MLVVNHQYTVATAQEEAPMMHPHARAHCVEDPMIRAVLVPNKVHFKSALKLAGHAVVFHHISYHVLRVAVIAHHVLSVGLWYMLPQHTNNTWIRVRQSR